MWKFWKKKEPQQNPLYRSTELANVSVECAFYEAAVFFGFNKSDTCNITDEWTKIYKAYNASNRYYHNMNHVYEMLLMLDEYASVTLSPNDYYIMMLAIIYHDFYNGVDAAEKKSAFEAVLLYYTCAEKPTMENGELLRETILATQDHKSDDPRIQWVIDFDLYRLTCPEEMWTPAIRMEYPQHSDEVFNKKRVAILEKFYNRTPFFYHLGNAASAQAYSALHKQIRNM